MTFNLAELPIGWLFEVCKWMFCNVGWSIRVSRSRIGYTHSWVWFHKSQYFIQILLYCHKDFLWWKDWFSFHCFKWFAYYAWKFYSWKSIANCRVCLWDLFLNSFQIINMIFIPSTCSFLKAVYPVGMTTNWSWTIDHTAGSWICTK